MRAFPRPLLTRQRINAAVCTPSQQKLPERGHQGTSQERDKQLQNPLEITSQTTHPRETARQLALSYTLPQGSPVSRLDLDPSEKDSMSTKSMIRDVELAEEVLSKKAGGPQGSRSCWCLSLFSFLLVAGATTLFCLLHFGVIGPQREEVSLWPALAHSPTQREMREKEGERWGGERGMLMGKNGEESSGERWGGRRRHGESGGRKGERQRNKTLGTWGMPSKYLLDE